MYYLADFIKPLETQNSPKKEKKKNKFLADIRTIADKTLYGTGGGLAITSMLPFRSKKIDSFLRHKRMNKLPIFGKAIRETAIQNTSKNPLGTRIVKNPAALVSAGLLGGTLGLGYGAYKVYKNRKKNRYD